MSLSVMDTRLLTESSRLTAEAALMLSRARTHMAMLSPGEVTDSFRADVLAAEHAAIRLAQSLGAVAGRNPFTVEAQFPAFTMREVSDAG